MLYRLDIRVTVSSTDGDAVHADDSWQTDVRAVSRRHALTKGLQRGNARAVVLRAFAPCRALVDVDVRIVEERGIGHARRGGW